MRFVIALLILLVVSGCGKTAKVKATPKAATPAAPTTPPAKPKPDDDKPVVTLDTIPTGRVLFVNRESRFVVLSFQPGTVPPINHRLNVYRDGLKVAEIKITGPQEENNTVADIITGAPHQNDDVRED